jgi:hypothetical protein
MRPLSDRTCWILGLLILVTTPACAFLASLLPWNMANTESHTVKDSRDVKLTPANPKDIDEDKDRERHGCCDSNDEETTVAHKRCNADGSSNDDGDYMCCAWCSKVCFKRPPWMSNASCSNPARHCIDWTGDNVNGFKCRHCNDDCPNLNLQSPPAKPPVPIPVPDCDLDTHCKAKESCKLIGGECCGKCHQGCPIWSSDQESE